MRCENCGSYDRCGCSWDEQLKAMRIKERKRRELLRKKGAPVIVDHLGAEVEHE